MSQKTSNKRKFREDPEPEDEPQLDSNDEEEAENKGREALPAWAIELTRSVKAWKKISQKQFEEQKKWMEKLDSKLSKKSKGVDVQQSSQQIPQQISPLAPVPSNSEISYAKILRENESLRKVILILKYTIDTQFGMIPMWPFVWHGEFIFVTHQKLLDMIVSHACRRSIALWRLKELQKLFTSTGIPIRYLSQENMKQVLQVLPLENPRSLSKDLNFVGIPAPILRRLFECVDQVGDSTFDNFRKAHVECRRTHLLPARGLGCNLMNKWNLTRKKGIYPSRGKTVAHKMQWGQEVIQSVFTSELYDAVLALGQTPEMEGDDWRDNKVHIGPGWCILHCQDVESKEYPPVPPASPQRTRAKKLKPNPKPNPESPKSPLSPKSPVSPPLPEAESSVPSI